jgi:hypothetical protein
MNKKEKRKKETERIIKRKKQKGKKKRKNQSPTRAVAPTHAARAFNDNERNCRRSDI